MSRLVHYTLLALTLLGACSSSGTGPSQPAQGGAALAAEQFSHLADSVARVGGDADVANAYGAIAGTVRAGGRVSSVTIAIDGTAASFLATAVQTEVTAVRGDAPIAGSDRTLRSVIAWDVADPKRVVQLSSASNNDPIAAMLYPSLLASYAPMAALVYMDGRGGTYFGTSGSHVITMSPSTVPCPGARDSSALYRSSSACTQADFGVAFDARAEPSAFLVANNTAKGVHTVKMLPQTVAGTRMLLATLCDPSCAPGGPAGPTVPTPPITVRPSSELPASLTVSVDSLVTLTLTVRNAALQPAKVVYPSSQKFDFVITDSATGRSVWRWSADRAFAMMVGEEMVPANGSLVFTAQWKPAGRGKYLAHGVLVSLSHRAEAYASVALP